MKLFVCRALTSSAALPARRTRRPRKRPWCWARSARLLSPAVTIHRRGNLAARSGWTCSSRPDGKERLRVGFTDVPAPAAGPGLRMFVNHTKCCNRNANGAAGLLHRPPPPSFDANCNVTQNAPLPTLVAETNVTMKIIVDGGLVEVFGMNAVALTAIAAPSPDVAPDQRRVQVFGAGQAGMAPACDVQGWKLVYKLSL